MTHLFSCYDYLHPSVLFSVTIMTVRAGSVFFFFYDYTLNLPRNARADCSLILSNPASFSVLYRMCPVRVVLPLLPIGSILRNFIPGISSASRIVFTIDYTRHGNSYNK